MHAVEVFTAYMANIFEMNKKFQNVVLIDKHTYPINNKNNKSEPIILFFRTSVKK